MDSIFEDSEEVMNRAGVKGRLHYGQHSKTTNYEKIVRYYKGFPKELMLRLYENFKVDFEVFGYSIPSWLWVHLSEGDVM